MNNTDSIQNSAAEFDFERRFAGVARLYGQVALNRFMRSHVCIVGVGGVGSWVVEALARSAIGQLTLVDLDHVAESNVNRQILALSQTLGKAKIEALAERIAQINPRCVVNLVDDFLNAENVDEILGRPQFDFVVDAIDDVSAKIALIAYCRQRMIPLITIGGAGGQVDPGKIEVRDLSRTEQEPLLAKVRKRLRAQHGFPRGTKNKFGIEAVFSMEPLKFPAGDESCSLSEASGTTGLNCAGFGSSVAVTASFGMVAAARVLNQLAAKKN